MSRPLRTVSARYAEARQQNPNAPFELSDSDTESISTSMIETVNQQTRRTSSASRGSPVSRSVAEDQEDSGSEYSTADDEQFEATPLAGSRSLEREYSFPGLYADIVYSGSNDSGIGGVGIIHMSAAHPSIAPSSRLNTAQARAAELLRKNYGPRGGGPGESPRHLERFPDLGDEPMALVEVPCSLAGVVTGAEEGVEGVQGNSGEREADDTQENESAPGQEMSILERTEQLLRRNHIPKRPTSEINFPTASAEIQSTTRSSSSSQERPKTSTSDQQFHQAVDLNFHLAGSTTTVNSQSTESSPIPGLKINTNRSRPNGLSNGLPSSTGNGRIIPPSTNGLRRAASNIKRKRSIFTPKSKGTEEEQLRAQGYDIEDTVQAFQEIEGRSREEAGLILEGHLDKIFGIAKPPSQYVDARRSVQVEEGRAGPMPSMVGVARMEDMRTYQDRCILTRIANKVRAVRKAIRGLGEKRGRTMNREGSKRGR